MNKFTIVIPTHNRNSGLFKTLNWIQRDVSNDTEVIVIDDYSDKPVNSSIISYFTKIKIKLIRMHKKSGASKCRNIGAEFASNEWIAFFDDDDYWLIGRNNYLSKLTENLTRKKNLIISSFIKISFFNIPKIIYRKATVKNLEIKNNLGGCSCIFIKKSFFNKLNGFDEKLLSCQDWDLYLRAKRFSRIHTSMLPNILYIQHKNAISNNLKSVYSGRKIFYFKHKPFLNKKARRMHLGYLYWVRFSSRKKIKLSMLIKRVFLIRYISPVLFINKIVKIIK